MAMTLTLMSSACCENRPPVNCPSCREISVPDHGPDALADSNNDITPDGLVDGLKVDLTLDKGPTKRPDKGKPDVAITDKGADKLKPDAVLPDMPMPDKMMPDLGATTILSMKLVTKADGGACKLGSTCAVVFACTACTNFTLAHGKASGNAKSWGKLSASSGTTTGGTSVDYTLPKASDVTFWPASAFIKLTVCNGTCPAKGTGANIAVKTIIVPF